MIQITGCPQTNRDNRKTVRQCWSPQCPHTRRWEGRDKGLKADALTDIPKCKSQKCEQRYNKKPGTQPQSYQRGSQGHWLYEQLTAATCASNGCSPGSWKVMLEMKGRKVRNGNWNQRKLKGSMWMLGRQQRSTKDTKRWVSSSSNTALAAARTRGEKGQKQKPRCVFSHGLKSSLALLGRAGKESCCRQSIRYRIQVFGENKICKVRA